MVETEAADEPVQEQPAAPRTLRQRWIVWRLAQRRRFRVWIRDALGISEDLRVAGLWIDGIRRDVDAVAESERKLTNIIGDLSERLAFYERHVPEIKVQRKRLDQMRSDGVAGGRRATKSRRSTTDKGGV